MTENLEPRQMEALMQAGPLLDAITPVLNPTLKGKLADLEHRTGEYYVSGNWTVPETGETFTNEPCPNPPTVEEATIILSEVYSELSRPRLILSYVHLVLSHPKFKRELGQLMKDMELSPEILLKKRNLLQR